MLQERNGRVWECDDETGAEIETQQFLYGLVRVLKPELVVETGTYKGVTAEVMARACKENNFGRVVTCDPYDHRAGQSKSHLFYPLEFRYCRSFDLPELSEADLVFCDSDYEYRGTEILRCKPGAVIVVHDTLTSHHSDYPPLEAMVKDLGGLNFTTARGFGIIVKQ